MFWQALYYDRMMFLKKVLVDISVNISSKQFIKTIGLLIF